MHTENKYEIQGINITVYHDEYRDNVWQYYSLIDGDDYCAPHGTGKTEDEAIGYLMNAIAIENFKSKEP